MVKIKRSLHWEWKTLDRWMEKRLPYQFNQVWALKHPLPPDLGPNMMLFSAAETSWAPSTSLQKFLKASRFEHEGSSRKFVWVCLYKIQSVTSLVHLVGTSTCYHIIWVLCFDRHYYTTIFKYSLSNHVLSNINDKCLVTNQIMENYLSDNEILTDS